MRGRWLVTLIALPLLGVAVLLPLVRGAPSGRVYTVREVVAGLAHRPSAWVGRVLLVRGWVRSAEVWVPPRLAKLFSVDSSRCPAATSKTPRWPPRFSRPAKEAP